jgi:hypothetical protein
LTAIVNETLDASGVKKWGDAKAVETALSYINMGLWQAMGKEAAQQIENFGAREALKHKHRLGEIAAQEAAQKRAAAAAAKAA